MEKRIIFGGIMIAVLLGVFWLDWQWENSYRSAHLEEFSSPTAGVPLAILFLPILWIGFWEFAKMAKGVGVKVHIKTGLVGVTLLACLPILYNAARYTKDMCLQLGHDNHSTLIRYLVSLLDTIHRFQRINITLTIAFVVMLIFAAQMLNGRLEDALRRVACTALGVLYLGLCGGIILSFRIHCGIGAVLMFIAAVKSADIGAYFTGSLIGQHKMIPWLSPGKTWEGLFGGLICAAVVAVLIWLIFGARGIFPPGLFDNMLQVALFGIIVGLAGQFGDLCESLMKRSAGVKDSGALVPEFGGVLDILDSPLLAGPIAFTMLVYVF